MTFLKAGLIRNALRVCPHVLEKALLQTPLTEWYRKIQFGLQALEDDKRYGCPVTAVTVENIVTAKSLMKEDPRITHEEV